MSCVARGAPCSVLAYESDALPADYLGHLLVASWADHRIEHFPLEQRADTGLVATRRQTLVQGGNEFRPVGLALAPAVGVAAAAAVVVFVASSGLGATLDAAAGDLAPADRRAQAMSAYADWSDLGAAFGPLLALTFAGSLGLRPSYTLGALLLASGAAAMLIAGRVRRVRQAAVA